MKIACAVDEIRSLTPDEIKPILDRDKTQSSHMKETFQTLANAEDAHMHRLHRQANSLLGEGVLPPLDKLKHKLNVE